MAINYPNYVVPEGYGNPDWFGRFREGYDFGQGLADQNWAREQMRKQQQGGMRQQRMMPSGMQRQAPKNPRGSLANHLSYITGGNSGTAPFDVNATFERLGRPNQSGALSEQQILDYYRRRRADLSMARAGRGQGW